jgi:hypothetical protein
LESAARRRDWRRSELDLVRGGVTPITTSADAPIRNLGR